MLSAVPRAGHGHRVGRRRVWNSHHAVIAAPQWRPEEARPLHRTIVREVKDGLRTFVLYKWYNIYLKQNSHVSIKKEKIYSKGVLHLFYYKFHLFRSYKNRHNKIEKRQTIRAAAITKCFIHC